MGEAGAEMLKRAQREADRPVRERRSMRSDAENEEFNRDRKSRWEKQKIRDKKVSVSGEQETEKINKLSRNELRCKEM